MDSGRVLAARASVATILRCLQSASPDEREAIARELRPIVDPGRLRQSLSAMAQDALDSAKVRE